MTETRNCRAEPIGLALSADGLRLPGDLALPLAGSSAGRTPLGLVVFVHGSGSSRLSPRNRAVASSLVERGCATLLFDLLTPDEEGERARVFDVERLAARLMEVIAALSRRDDVGELPLGLFGASTGAAAALIAAASLAPRVSAVVSRGGRPDLAALWLGSVRAPTLLIVGERDEEVLRLNRNALDWMHCKRQLAIVPGATHLFEEHGALDVVALLAADWFTRHFRAACAGRAGAAAPGCAAGAAPA